MAVTYNGKTVAEWENEVSDWEYYLKHPGSSSVEYMQSELKKAGANSAANYVYAGGDHAAQAWQGA